MSERSEPWLVDGPAGLAGDQNDARKARGASTGGRSEDSPGGPTFEGKEQ